MRPRGLVLAGLVAIAACFDPTQERAEDALGPEAAGVPQGPLHRPGQPCNVCHGKYGSTSPEFFAAGTVYAREGSPEPLAGATVRIVDGAGRVVERTTNVVGNFFVEAGEGLPVPPLFVELEHAGFKKRMISRIGRDGGCGRCHRATTDASHTLPVVLKERDEP